MLTPRRQLARAALVMVLLTSVCLLLELLVVSNVQQRAAQQRAFDSFRADLAAGTAPIGPTDADGTAYPPGTPVAYLEIPALGVRQVVGSGTSGSILFDGPGHRRDTPLPGQSGTSLIMGRRAAFGGPFSDVERLEDGDLVRVTTGQGAFDFHVIGVREEGDPVPAPPAAGEGRLILATAAGMPFMPDGVLRVDAELDGDAVGGARPLIATGSLPDPEQLMGVDASTLWALALWLQAMIVVSAAGVWAWHRWGRAQAWVVFVPPLLLVGISGAGEAARLLPNLL